MFCRYCGNQIPDTARFCSQCGKPVAKPGAATQPQPQPKPKPQPQPKPQPRPTPTAGGLSEFLKGHKAVAIAACAVLVVVCGFVVSSMGHSDPPASSRSGSGGSSSQKSGSSVAAKPAAAKVILVADPAPFFDVEPDEVEEDGDGSRYHYTMALSHTIIDEYLDVLAVHYDLEPSDTETSMYEARYSFDIPLEIAVEYNNPRSNMVLTLTCGEGVQLEDSGVESSHPGWKSTAIPHSSGSGSSKAPATSSKASSSASSKAPASSSKPSSSSGSSKASGGKVSKSSTAVPDLGKFLGVPQTPTETKNYFPYDIDDEKGIKSVDEWRELLTGSYNFKETGHSTDDFTKVSSKGLICYTYYFDYTGSAKIEGKEWPAADQKADVFLLVNYYTTEDHYGISIRLADGLTLEDSGKKASDPPNHKDVSGGGGSESGGGSGGSNIPEFAKQDCPICKGTKKCQTCGGRGYLYSHASGKYDRNCTDCHNHDGKCTYCNGTGKR